MSSCKYTGACPWIALKLNVINISGLQSPHEEKGEMDVWRKESGLHRISSTNGALIN